MKIEWRNSGENFVVFFSFLFINFPLLKFILRFFFLPLEEQKNENLLFHHDRRHTHVREEVAHFAEAVCS